VSANIRGRGFPERATESMLICTMSLAVYNQCVKRLLSVGRLEIASLNIPFVFSFVFPQKRCIEYKIV
jgi:hypothetical protein